MRLKVMKHRFRNTEESVIELIVEDYNGNEFRGLLELKRPEEGDKKQCPECKDLMEWVSLGEPEGEFWSCDCGYENIRKSSDRSKE